MKQCGAALIALSSLAMTACGDDGGDDPQPSVSTEAVHVTSSTEVTAPTDVTASTVEPDAAARAPDRTIEIAVGETLTVGMGQWNASIGDALDVQLSDDAVVEVTQDDILECREPGCGGELDVLVTGRAAGRATVTLQYCFRSAGPTCAPAPGDELPDPIVWEVVVD